MERGPSLSPSPFQGAKRRRLPHDRGLPREGSDPKGEPPGGTTGKRRGPTSAFYTFACLRNRFVTRPSA